MWKFLPGFCYHLTFFFLFPAFCGKNLGETPGKFCNGWYVHLIVVLFQFLDEKTKKNSGKPVPGSNSNPQPKQIPQNSREGSFYCTDLLDYLISEKFFLDQMEKERMAAEEAERRLLQKNRPPPQHKETDRPSLRKRNIKGGVDANTEKTDAEKPPPPPPTIAQKKDAHAEKQEKEKLEKERQEMEKEKEKLEKEKHAKEKHEKHAKEKHEKDKQAKEKHAKDKVEKEKQEKEKLEKEHEKMEKEKEKLEKEKQEKEKQVASKQDDKLNKSSKRWTLFSFSSKTKEAKEAEQQAPVSDVTSFKQIPLRKSTNEATAPTTPVPQEKPARRNTNDFRPDPQQQEKLKMEQEKSKMEQEKLKLQQEKLKMEIGMEKEKEKKENEKQKLEKGRKSISSVFFESK